MATNASISRLRLGRLHPALAGDLQDQVDLVVAVADRHPLVVPQRRAEPAQDHPAQAVEVGDEDLLGRRPVDGGDALRISSRALLVNVRQRIDAGINPLRISRPVRSVSVLVFPDPGPASVRIRP